MRLKALIAAGAVILVGAVWFMRGEKPGTTENVSETAEQGTVFPVAVTQRRVRRC